MILLLLAAAAWEAQTPAAVGIETMRALAAASRVEASVRVSIARQPVSVLRAIAGERLPEQAALYSIRACAAGGRAVVDPGAVEQAIVASGISVTPRELAQLAVARSRNRGLSTLARLGEAASVVAPVVVGFAATGGLSLVAWQVAAISGFGQGLRIISDATKVERESAARPIVDLGPWLSDMPSLTLEPGQCSRAMLVLGSFDPRRRAEVIELR